MLRLVHPRPAGQEKRVPRGGKSDALIPTHEEKARIRAAVRNLRRAYGGYDVLAAVTGVSIATFDDVLYRKWKGSYALAVVLARAAAIPVEQLLSGRPHVAGTCVVCGRKGAK